MVFFQRVQNLTLVTKCTAAKFVKRWMSSHFCKWDFRYIGSAMWPEFSRKDWQAKSYWFFPHESSRWDGRRTMWYDCIWLGPVLMLSEHNYQSLLTTMRYLQPC